MAKKTEQDKIQDMSAGWLTLEEDGCCCFGMLARIVGILAAVAIVVQAVIS